MDHDHDHEHTHDDAAEWEERYSADDQVWSGHVNGSLVDEVGDWTPGRALDVGCGEGADAVWLAERGWAVTAIDIAPSAIARAIQAATGRDLDIDFRAADILDSPDQLGSHDLVSVQYPAFAIDRLGDVKALIETTVAPEGAALIVGHAPPNDPDSIPFDPDDYVQPPDLASALGDTWTIEVDETRPRPGHHHHGSHHMEDVVLLLRRPA